MAASGWQDIVRSVIKSAAFVADRIDFGETVLVHCSDGFGLQCVEE